MFQSGQNQIVSKCYLVDTDTAQKVTDQRISGYLSIRIHALEFW